MQPQSRSRLLTVVLVLYSLQAVVVLLIALTVFGAMTFSSPEDIELDGISQGAVETETDIPEAEADSEIEHYDFRQQAGPLHTRMPGLNIITERLAGILSTSLSTATRSTVDVSLTSIETIKFTEFSR